MRNMGWNMESRIRRVYDSKKDPEDPDYLYTYLQNKAPPNINTLYIGRSSNTALNSIAQNTAPSTIDPTIK